MLLLTRNDPFNHPMLRRLLSECGVESLESLHKQKLFHIFHLISLPGSSDLLLADDPIAFMCGWVIVRKGIKHRRFWALEIYEHQISLSGWRSYLRWIVFSCASTISFRLADSVVFPSGLRKQYALSTYSSAHIDRKSSILPNISVLSKPDNELPVDVSTKLMALRNQFKVIAIYSGSLQPGRGLINIINAVEAQKDNDIALVLCGPVKASLINVDSIAWRSTTFLGNFNPNLIAAIYQRCDVGVLSYENDPINTRLCAPVKMWEYLLSGLRIVGNDNYALKSEWSNYIDAYFDLTSESVVDAILMAANNKTDKPALPVYNAEILVNS